MSQGRIVSNAKNWIDMDGETALEKRLNSLITVSFIGSRDVPSDECIMHAIVIIEIKADPESDEYAISDYLSEQFLMKPSQTLLDKIDKCFEKWKKETQSSTNFQ